MVYHWETYKAKKLVGKEKIALLASATKKFEFEGIHDILEANKLSSLIFDEWFSLDKQYKNKLYGKNNISTKLYAQYDAEKHIIIGLATLLNEKMMRFMSQFLARNNLM